MDNATAFSIFLGWLIFSFVAGAIASRKGRPSLLYFLIALALSPLVGIVIALAVAPNSAQLERRAIRSGRGKKCPFCAEVIKAEAKTCRYCGRDVPVVPATEKESASDIAIYLSRGDGDKHGPSQAARQSLCLRRTLHGRTFGALVFTRIGKPYPIFLVHAQLPTSAKVTARNTAVHSQPDRFYASR